MEKFIIVCDDGRTRRANHASTLRVANQIENTNRFEAVLGGGASLAENFQPASILSDLPA